MRPHAPILAGLKADLSEIRSACRAVGPAIVEVANVIFCLIGVLAASLLLLSRMLFVTWWLRPIQLLHCRHVERKQFPLIFNAIRRGELSSGYVKEYLALRLDTFPNERFYRVLERADKHRDVMATIAWRQEVGLTRDRLN